MAGIIPEQHPDRTRLFMQWKQMDWPILIDPLNLLGVTAVPITLLIDEHGIIRYIRPGDDELQELLERTYERPAQAPAVAETPDLENLEKRARDGSPDALRRYANALVLWGDDASLARAIEAYESVLEAEPGRGADHFRLGVAYRKRYDSNARRDGDFAKAVEHWGRALDIDPNQYIWRRRIQQYGPRLTKPYPFYDWVHRAREEIAERGELPLPLPVEPGGAEFAHPMDTFHPSGGRGREPDPRGRIHRDEEGLIRVETTIVPSVVSSGQSARIHVSFRPNPEVKAHWNNEVDELVFWIDPPKAWQVDRRYLTAPLPPEPVSREVRKLELEVKTPDGFTGSATIRAYALYYVCEDVDGTCLYRRQDIPVRVTVGAP